MRNSSAPMIRARLNSCAATEKPRETLWWPVQAAILYCLFERRPGAAMPSRSRANAGGQPPVEIGRRRSTSAMLPPPTADAEPTQCKARATGAGASLAMMATLGFLWGGACFGFNGIKTVFLDEGLFADACDHGDRCKAQINQVDAAWTFASAMLNVMALVNGSLSDALGLRRLCLLSSALLSWRAPPLRWAFYLVVTRRRYEQPPVSGGARVLCARRVGHAPLLRRSGAAGGTGLPRAAVLAAVRCEGCGGADDGDGLRARHVNFPTLRLIHDGVRGANLS